MASIHDLKAILPSEDELSQRLVRDLSTLSQKAKRLHHVIERNVQANGGHLETTLSTSFLDANVPELQVALNNMLDAEQGGDLRAWTRVCTALASVEKISNEDDRLISQVLNKKALKAFVQDVVSPYVVTGSCSGEFGNLWRPPLTVNDEGAGLQRCPAGWQTSNSNVDTAAIVPPANEFKSARLGSSISLGELPYAPCPFLRGVKELPSTFSELVALDVRLVLISCVDPGAAFEKSLGGTLTRQLLAPVLKRFRSAVIVIASSAWCDWWKTQLSATVGAGNEKRRKRREIVEFVIGGNGNVLPSGQELLTCSEMEQAAGVQRWYKFTNALVHKAERLDEEPEAADKDASGDEDIQVGKGPKTLSEFFHKTCGPLYPISVSDNVIDAVQGNASIVVSGLTESEIVALSKPMEWVLSEAVHEKVFIYGRGRGVVVSDLQVSEYENKLDAFVSASWSFYPGACDGLGKAQNFNEVCDVLSKVNEMPFTLARLPDNLAKDVVHLFLGQDYKEGWTFSNQVGGSSVPVRAVHRMSGLSDNQFATFDVLPCNHDWHYDLDYFVSCPTCRPSVTERKKYNDCKHISPSLPEEPKSCTKCKLRWTATMDWLCLQLAGMIRAVALSGARVFVTPGGTIARAVFNRLCRNAPAWLREVKLQMPTRDVCHPNAVTFARTEGQIRKLRADYGRLAIELRNFRSGGTSQRWEGGISKFYDELQAVFEPFNPSICNMKRMAAAKAARDVLTPLIEKEVRSVNVLLGKGLSLEPLDLQVRLTRLLSQLHLQKLAVSPQLAEKISLVVAKVDVPVVANVAVAKPGGGDLSRNEKRTFLRQCNVYLVECLGDSSSVRGPLLDRLGLRVGVLDPAVEVIRGRAKGWKQEAGQYFQKSVSSLLGKLRHRPLDLKILVRHGPAAMLDCVSNVCNNQFMLDEDKVRALLQKAPPEAAHIMSCKPVKAKKSKPPDGFCFAPKLPVVKTVFETKLPIGMFLVSRTVASEIIVSAARQVLAPENLKKVGLNEALIAGNIPAQVIRTALIASFDRQREYFGTGVEGARASFLSGMDRMLECNQNGMYRCKDHVACVDKSISKSFLLSLFDYRRVIAKSHFGKVSARTDGRSLNLTGLLPKNTKKGKKKTDEETVEEKRKMFWKVLQSLSNDANEKVKSLEAKVDEMEGADPRLQTDLENAKTGRDNVEVLFVGLDCGKSGLNAVMAPHIIRKAVKIKAQAEAELAMAEKFGHEGSIAASKILLEDATLTETEARRLFEEAQVPSLSKSRPNSLPLRKNRSEKGAHSITKGCRRSELLEVQLQKEREERLKVFDECVVTNSSHGAMSKLLLQLNCVAFNADAELAAIKSRLSVYHLLKIANKSGSQRKGRRTTAIKRRGFTARATRLLTKDLPEAVRASPDKFLKKSLAFPKRSPQSRQRDKVRGWERGVNRAMGAIEASKSTCHLPVWIATDMFSGKGQRILSTFPFQELYRSMLRLIRSCPKLSARVMVYVDNGYRSSRQAAGTMCYLANMDRANHQKVQALNLPHDWLGEVQDGFGYFYCPVTCAILKRDPPAAMSMGTIGVCTFYNAPRPQIWAPAQTAAE